MARVLALDKFPLLVTMLPANKRRAVAAAVVDAVAASGAPITQVSHVRMLVAYVRPLVFDDNDADLVRTLPPHAMFTGFCLLMSGYLHRVFTGYPFTGSCRVSVQGVYTGCCYPEGIFRILIITGCSYRVLFIGTLSFR